MVFAVSFCFNPNQSLGPEQISLDCLPLVRSRSGLRRERTKKKDANKIMKDDRKLSTH